MFAAAIAANSTPGTTWPAAASATVADPKGRLEQPSPDSRQMVRRARRSEDPPDYGGDERRTDGEDDLERAAPGRRISPVAERRQHTQLEQELEGEAAERERGVGLHERLLG